MRLPQKIKSFMHCNILTCICRCKANILTVILEQIPVPIDLNDICWISFNNFDLFSSFRHSVLFLKIKQILENSFKLCIEETHSNSFRKRMRQLTIMSVSHLDCVTVLNVQYWLLLSSYTLISNDLLSSSLLCYVLIVSVNMGYTKTRIRWPIDLMHGKMWRYTEISHILIWYMHNRFLKIQQTIGVLFIAFFFVLFSKIWRMFLESMYSQTVVNAKSHCERKIT